MSIQRAGLDRGRVASLLADAEWTLPMPVIRETVTSTNAEVTALAGAGAAEGTCVVADEQTAGRGRQGRDWVSPPSAGLWMSFLVRPGDIPRSRWGWLPLLAGLAARDAIGTLGRVPVALKWPNDLVVESATGAGSDTETSSDTGATSGSRAGGAFGAGLSKLGGILSEAHGAKDAAGGEAVVIGIGINVALAAEELPTPQATSLLLEGGSVDREALLVSVLRHLVVRLEQWRSDDSQLLRDYRGACITLGRIVEVSLPGGRVERGEAVSIDEHGHLQVISDGNLVSITAGDVIHATI